MYVTRVLQAYGHCLENLDEDEVHYNTLACLELYTPLALFQAIRQVPIPNQVQVANPDGRDFKRKKEKMLKCMIYL